MNSRNGILNADTDRFLTGVEMAETADISFFVQRIGSCFKSTDSGHFPVILQRLKSTTLDDGRWTFIHSMQLEWFHFKCCLVWFASHSSVDQTGGGPFGTQLRGRSNEHGDKNSNGWMAVSWISWSEPPVRSGQIQSEPLTQRWVGKNQCKQTSTPV